MLVFCTYRAATAAAAATAATTATTATATAATATTATAATATAATAIATAAIATASMRHRRRGSGGRGRAERDRTVVALLADVVVAAHAALVRGAVDVRCRREAVLLHGRMRRDRRFGRRLSAAPGLRCGGHAALALLWQPSPALAV